MQKREEGMKNEFFFNFVLINEFHFYHINTKFIVISNSIGK